MSIDRFYRQNIFLPLLRRLGEPCRVREQSFHGLVTSCPLPQDGRLQISFSVEFPIEAGDIIRLEKRGQDCLVLTAERRAYGEAFQCFDVTVMQRGESEP